IEQCCEVLASIESQTSRLCKQFEKIDNAQKDERRRSLSKDCSATIMAELANLLNELKSVHVIMDNIKESNPTFLQRSPQRELASSQSATCARCMENQKVIEEQQNEIVFYKKKNKDLTNQLDPEASEELSTDDASSSVVGSVTKKSRREKSRPAGRLTRSSRLLTSIQRFIKKNLPDLATSDEDNIAKRKYSQDT
ncbi:hypothetical protein TELCIR_03326, partial [Teladorsagia circumcincta]